MSRIRWRGALLLLFIGLTLVLLASPWLLRPSRSNYTAVLADGIVYYRQALDQPRPLLIHVVRIDLQQPSLGLLVTPGQPQGAYETTAQTTSAFAAEYETLVAINGSFFQPFNVNHPFDFYPQSADGVNVNGFSMSNGQVYAEGDTRRGVLCYQPEAGATIVIGICPTDSTQGLAGGLIFLEAGQPTIRSNPTSERHPRTAVALDATGQIVWLIVVDGRQPGYSEGVTMAELAEIAQNLGATTALNLDGGGSSTLVAAGHFGPRVLNSPVHTGIPQRERPIANHLGVISHSPR